jgi:hypothetical protein
LKSPAKSSTLIDLSRCVSEYDPVRLGRLYRRMLDERNLSNRALAAELHVAEGTIRHLLTALKNEPTLALKNEPPSPPSPQHFFATNRLHLALREFAAKKCSQARAALSRFRAPKWLHLKARLTTWRDAGGGTHGCRLSPGGMRGTTDFSHRAAVCGQSHPGFPALEGRQNRNSLARSRRQQNLNSNSLCYSTRPRT